MQLLSYGDGASLLGWLLIMAGLALAADALLDLRRPRRHVAYIQRAYRRADWSARQGSPDRATQPIDEATQWQRLAAIAEHSIAQAEQISALHARAIAELEAADEALIQLFAARDRQPSPLPAPAAISEPAAQPVAA